MSDTPQAAISPKDGFEHVVSTLACIHSPVILYLADSHGVHLFDWVSPNIEAIIGQDARAVVSDRDYFRRHIYPHFGEHFGDTIPDP